MSLYRNHLSLWRKLPENTQLEYDDMMTTEEAKEALKIGTNTLYKLLRSGKLKAFRLGRIWKIPKAAVEEYIRESAGLWKK